MRSKGESRSGFVKSSLVAVLLGAVTMPVLAESSVDKLRNMFRSVNSHGIDATYSTAGYIDLNNPFFKSLGTNGRSCSTCHVPSEGWVITPKGVQARFEKPGMDRSVNDGAHFLLQACQRLKKPQGIQHPLSKATIRVGVGIPANAELHGTRG
jgi:hypothetical protein